MFQNGWVYDVEVYPNLFTIVARLLDSKEYKKFIIGDTQNDTQEIKKWLTTRPVLIGYNNLEFDGQIVEWIYQTDPKEITAGAIYAFMDKLPIKHGDRFDLPYTQWDLSFKQIDLYKINHYDNKRTSLKWLEFTTRWAKLKDLPIQPESIISKSRVVDVVRYNTNDVNMTYDFFYRCIPMIELRQELAAEYRQGRIINMSDSSFGSYIFEHILTKDYGMKKKELKKGTHYKFIKGSECLADNIYFESDVFKGVHETFRNRVYQDVATEGIKGEKYNQMALFSDMVFVFGSGGLHACYKAGEYTSDDEYVTMSVDVKSYYPNLGISNGFYPQHIGPSFCKIYKQVYDKRTTYDKGSALNYGYKIALNSVYGKSNDMNSIFYDPMYTLKITINGQLLLTMLAEQLAKLGRLLMVNTDGIEVRIHRSKINELYDACQQWELVTDLELEYVEYDKLVIKDVNNYIAVDKDGHPKRKGMFEIYEDITEEGGKSHFYNKTPNATVIPNALFNYYVNNKSIIETVEGENNIHEFCFGIKKQSNFVYWLITAKDSGVIDIDQKDDRVLRYHISEKGANIYKLWRDGRKNTVTAVNKGQLVTLVPSTVRTTIDYDKKLKGGVIQPVRQWDVDREYYINEAQKVVDLINLRTRDKPYIKYMKLQEKLAKEQALLNQTNA